MFFVHVKLKNWRNFRTLDVPLRDVTYLLGPNASGKSNLLDVFRFLRDISKPKGVACRLLSTTVTGSPRSVACMPAATRR